MMNHGVAFLATAAMVVACSPSPEKAEHPTVREERNQPPLAEGGSAAPGRGPTIKDSTTMTLALPQALEAELAAIRHDPGEAIGFGLKAYLPYEPNQGNGLMGSPAAEVTRRLLAEARGDGDRVYRLAVLHVLGKRDGGDVDAALINALEDPTLRATAAYLLGRAGFKGYPTRPRDLAKVATALRLHLTDTGTFEDPFYRRTFRTQDFVLAAYVRVTGVAQFRIANRDVADLVGLGLPELNDATRRDLLAQAMKASQ